MDEIEHLPAELFDLQQLQQLVVQGLNIRSIPAEISRLVGLNHLSIVNTPGIGGIPESVLQLTALKVSAD